MKHYFLAAFTIVFCLCGQVTAQDFGWGIKGGPSMGFQKWDTGSQRDALFSYHAIAFVESVTEGNAFSTFAQLGYHVRGGAVRTNAFNYVNPVTGLESRSTSRTDRYEFRNVSLSLGAKQKFELGSGKYYYMIGVRGDYTISTNLEEYENRNTIFNTLYFPQNQFVRKFNYGLIFGGGLERDFSEFITGIFEISVNPDVSKQYRQPPIGNVYNPYTMNNYNTPSREFSSVSLEVSVGIRFLTKVEYVD